MQNSDQLLAGVELGGTKCICTLASGPDRIAAQETINTRAPEETLAAIEAVLDGWRRSPGFAALGVASFGPIDLDPASASYGHMLATPKPGWAGADVGKRLRDRYGLPFGFDTDVNGAALAEIAWGSGEGLADFAYVTVGTGVGVGLIVNGRPTRGIGHSELGHLRVPRLAGDELPSGCPFHPDCVEGMSAGPGLRAAFGGAPIPENAPDHPVWDRVVHTLACLCHSLICTTGPRRIAIGGGVFGRQPHLLPRVEPAMRASLNGYMRLPDEAIVVAPALGGQAGPLGSIALAMAALTSR